MIKAYKYRLYPTKQQEILLAKHFGCVRFVYNWGLSQKIEAYQQDKTNLSKFDLSNQLPSMKKTSNTWLKEVNSQSLQAKLEDLDTAFVSFFRKKNKFPTFKSKKNKQSFRVPQKIAVKDDKLCIPKFREGIKCIFHRSLVGEIKQCTVSKTKSGKYFVSILVEDGLKSKKKCKVNKKTTIGIDLGVKTFATLSNGRKIDNPKYLKKYLTRLQKESSRHSKCKDNTTKEKLRKRLAKIHEKIANCRKDFHHKLSYELTHDKQVKTIILETLDIQSMLDGYKQTNRSIIDCGWYQFITFLIYKSEWYGINLHFIGQFEPSSKMCSCGIVNSTLDINDRIWTCSACNAQHNRDILAANNIKRFGLESLAKA